MHKDNINDSEFLQEVERFKYQTSAAEEATKTAPAAILLETHLQKWS